MCLLCCLISKIQVLKLLSTVNVGMRCRIKKRKERNNSDHHLHQSFGFNSFYYRSLSFIANYLA